MDKVLEDDRRIMAMGTLHRFEETVVIAPNDRRTYVTIKIPFHDAQGQVIGLVGVSRDISSSKQN